MTKKRKIGHLGETELEVLTHVWWLGEASVSDVRDRILDSREIAYTTVMTVMKNLAEKSYLTYRKEGKSYIYRAVVSPEYVRRSLVDELVEKVFQGSPGNLVQTLVRSEALSDEEREKIRQLIDQMED